MSRHPSLGLPLATYRLRLSLLVLALSVLPSASHAVEPDPGALVAIDDQVSVLCPADMAREQRSLGTRGDMLTLSDGNDVLAVVVYRRDGADKPPPPAEALRVHVDELERALGPATRAPSKRRVLGRDQNALTLTLTREGVARDAWVVATESRGMTIVVSAVLIQGSPNEAAFASVLKGIKVQ